MIDSQIKLPPISFDWTSFDRFHDPLNSFNEHMAKVIFDSWSDPTPSLLNRVFSIALSPIIYPLCGLSALIGIVCHALGMTFFDEDKMFSIMTRADMESLNEVFDLGIIRNDHIIEFNNPIAERCFRSEFQIAKFLIDQIDTSEVFTTNLQFNMNRCSDLIRANITPDNTEEFEEIALLLDHKLKEWQDATGEKLDYQIERSLNVEVDTANPIQYNDGMKEKIAADINLWLQTVNLENFQNQKIKLFYGTKVNASPAYIIYTIDTSEKLDEVIKNHITSLQLWIDERFFNHQTTIDIEFLIVGELRLEEDNRIVDFQSFRQSYVGTKGTGFPGLYDFDLEDSFMSASKNFKLFSIPTQIWNEDGSFKGKSS